MNKLLTITRDGQTRKTLARQFPHDIQLKPGSKLKMGSGRMWLVVEVSEAPEYNPA